MGVEDGVDLGVPAEPFQGGHHPVAVVRRSGVHEHDAIGGRKGDDVAAASVQHRKRVRQFANADVVWRLLQARPASSGDAHSVSPPPSAFEYVPAIHSSLLRSA